MNRALGLMLLVWLCLPPLGCGSRGSSVPAGPSFAELVAGAEAEGDAELRARRLIDIGRQQAAAQDMFGAQDTLARAAKACSQIGDPAVQARLYVELGKVLLESDAKVPARKAVADAAGAVARVDDSATRAELLAVVAAAQQMSGDRVAAAKTLDQAELLARELSDAEAKVHVLAGVAVVYQVRMATTDEARRVLESAERIAEEIADLSARARSQALIAYAWHRCGQFTQADAAYELAAGTARQIEAPFSRAFALVSLAEEALKTGRNSLAKTWLDEAEQTVPQVPEADLQQQLRDKIRALRAKV